MPKWSRRCLTVTSGRSSVSSSVPRRSIAKSDAKASAFTKHRLRSACAAALSIADLMTTCTSTDSSYSLPDFKISFLPTTTSDEMLTLAMARSDSFHSDVCVTSTRTRAVFGVPRAY
jgi:hypothetical protein